MRRLSRLGLGLAALGRPAYINVGRDRELPARRTVAAMREVCWSVLDAAYAAGIRWIDAARSYGRAEEFLAGWLAERGPTRSRSPAKGVLRLRRRLADGRRRPRAQRALA